MLQMTIYYYVQILMFIIGNVAVCQEIFKPKFIFSKDSGSPGFESVSACVFMFLCQGP